MKRFEYERRERGECFAIFDRLRSHTLTIATVYDETDAEMIVNALNAIWEIEHEAAAAHTAATDHR